MGEMNRDEVIESLVQRGARRDLAAQYADAFVEYRDAQTNIRDNGAMVLHPRTANPIENPYLGIRDRALAKLQKMRQVDADHLW